MVVEHLMKATRKILSVFTFLLFTFSAHHVSSENLVVPAEHCACNPGSEDKFEDPSKFNFGAYSGQCVDSCRYRRSVFLKLDDTINSEKESVVVSNLMHEDGYWTAEIPLSRAERAEVGFEEFMPGVFHVFLVFHFPKEHPVLLYPQKKKSSLKRVFEIILSPEGIPPKEGKYNLFDAYMERYLIGMRLLSKEQMVEGSVKKLKHKVTIYPLQLEQIGIREVLLVGLQSVQKETFRKKYGLFSNNCATNTLDFIDKVVKPEIEEFPIYYHFFYALERSIPVAGPLGTFRVFLSRNLIRTDQKSVL